MTDSAPETSQGTGPGTPAGDAPTATLPPVAPEPAAVQRSPEPAAASAGGGGLPSWAPFAVIGAVVVAAIAVVLALTVFSSDDDDGVAAYGDKVSTVVAPVITANERLSTALTSLRGTGSTNARRKVAAAQSATTAARGGLAALTVPGGAEQTALNARQTLTREASYLQAVRVVLANPAGDASPTQTLAANLTGALDVIAPAGQDWSQSVQGADRLTAWAPKAAATIRARKAAARKKAAATRRARSGGASSSRSSSSTPAPPSSAGTDCGGGLHSGPNTTCAFAQNVRRAWGEAPGSTNTLRVYSPVTGQTYTMNCAPAGGGITCSGGNNASVSWD
jgi:hypothetical protein